MSAVPVGVSRQSYHHRQSGLGGWGGWGSRLTPTSIRVPRTSGRGWRVPREACSCVLGCRPAQARPRTWPYRASSPCPSAVGGRQLAGSEQSNVCPWRRGRPVGGCAVGSAEKERPARKRTRSAASVSCRPWASCPESSPASKTTHGLAPAAGNRRSPSRICSAAATLTFSCGRSRRTLRGAVQLSGAQPTWAIQ